MTASKSKRVVGKFIASIVLMLPIALITNVRFQSTPYLRASIKTRWDLRWSVFYNGSHKNIEFNLWKKAQPVAAVSIGGKPGVYVRGYYGP